MRHVARPGGCGVCLGSPGQRRSGAGRRARAALLQQVMQLTAEQIASLPPAQRAQVEALQQHMVKPHAPHVVSGPALDGHKRGGGQSVPVRQSCSALRRA